MNPSDLNAYLQTAIGIAVSIVLFLVGYRQTVGARKERARAANASLQRALLRRVVLEGYTPLGVDVDRLIEGKAREFQVRAADLLSGDQVLVDLFTAVFDSDLIAPPQRADIEDRLRGAITARSQGVLGEAGGAAGSMPPDIFADRESRTGRYISALAVVTTLVGTVTAFLPQVLRGQLFDQQSLLVAVAVFVASMAAIVVIVTVRRNREAPADAQVPQNSVLRSAALEAKVAQILDRAGVAYDAAVKAGYHRADFVVTSGNRKVVLEVKAWPAAVPIDHIRRTLDQASKLQEEINAGEVLIVVPDRSLIPRPYQRSGDVSFVVPKELPSLLKRRAA